MEICYTEKIYHILVRRDYINEFSSCPVMHDVYVQGDGSVYLKEYIRKPVKDEKLHDAICKNWSDFVQKFPIEASLITDWNLHQGRVT